MERVGGKRKVGDLTASQIFSRRLKEVRDFHGWTQEQLSTHLRKADVNFSQETIAKLEKDTTRADHLTVNELFAICVALHVSPIFMTAPLDEHKPRLYISKAVQPPDPREARAWLRGEKELDGQDPRTFAVQRPDDEQAEALRKLPASYVGQITSAWRPPKEET
jgi:transcriptional regulator with XRE-family HTH domain